MYALVKEIERQGNLLSNDVEVPNVGEPQYSITLFNGETQFFDKNGIGYAPSYLRSWNAQEKKDHGIYEVVYGVESDSRFYNNVENAPVFEDDIVTVTFAATAKDLNDGEINEDTNRPSSIGLKSQWISNYKNIANSMLASTDWMVVRKIERNIDIPADIAAKRAAVVAEANRLETAIAEVTTVDQLITVVNSANFEV